MTIIADPANEESTHHIKLTRYDGYTPASIGLIACDQRGRDDPRGIRLSSQRSSTIVTQPNVGRFNDRKPPYASIELADFSGGHGAEDWDRNTTKFLDSGFMWTMTPGKLYPAPMFKPEDTRWDYGWVSRDGRTGQDWPSENYLRINDHTGDWTEGGVWWWDTVNGAWATANPTKKFTWIARKFLVPYDMNPKYIDLIVHAKGVPYYIKAYIYTSISNHPNLQVTNGVTQQRYYFERFPYGLYEGVVGDHMGEVMTLEFSTAPSLVGLTEYWLVVQVNNTGNTEFYPPEWGVGGHYQEGYALPDTMFSMDGTNWEDTAYDFQLYYRVYEGAPTINNKGCWLFEYKRAIYLVDCQGVSNAPRLFLNGHTGIATGTQTGNQYLKDTTANFDVEVIGKTVIITEGTNAGEERRIIDSTFNQLEVFPPFPALPTVGAGGTEYVILGCNQWKAITGHGLTGPFPHRPAVINDVIYFCQGDGTNIRRGRFHNSAGTWTATWSDDAFKASKLIQHRKQDGEFQVWGYNNDIANDDANLFRCAPQKWGTNLSKDKTIKVKDWSYKLTNIHSHDGYLWALKENTLVGVLNDVMDEVLPELGGIAGASVGKAVITKTPYMYFSAGPNVEEFYGKVASNMGPNKGSIPLKKVGDVVDFAVSPAFLFAAVDANTGYVLTRPGTGSVRMGGFSHVDVYSGGGWHEIYRAPMDDRIRSIWYQPIPQNTGRLWIASDKHLGCLEMPQAGNEPCQEMDIIFAWEGYVRTGYISDNLIDIAKHYGSYTGFGENLDYGYREFGVSYRIDDDTYFAEFGTINSTKTKRSPGTNWSYVFTGNRVQVQLVAHNYFGDNVLPPLMQSLIVDYIGRFPTGDRYDVTFRLSDIDGEAMEDLQGDAGDYTVAQIKAWLDSAKDSPVRMLMECVVPEFHNKYVIIEDQPLVPVEVTPGESHTLIGNVAVLEAEP